jgi:hypothetical protein
MINPFRYGGVVGKDAFCNRKRELTDLIRAMKNGERLFLYSERRMGKTSLVRLALSNLPKRRFLGAYVDLWATDGEASFTTSTAKAISEELGTTADKMLRAARQFFERLAPTVSMDASGNPQLTFTAARPISSGPDLKEVLDAPAKIASRRKCRVVVVFDEFQRILEYGSDLTERTLRSVIQNQRDVSYIFLGSRKHLVQKMFLDKSRPLYRAGAHYPLGPIGSKDWLPFIRERFRNSNKQIDAELISEICNMTGGHPFYTQHLCHAVWEICESGKRATSATLESALRLLLERESYAYAALWESFTMNQRRFLTGLAASPEKPEVYSGGFVSRYNLRSHSAVQRVVNTLLERDVIDRDNGSLLISDRFFKIWICQAGMGTP